MEESKQSIVERCLIRPSTPTSTHHQELFLSSMDLIWLPYHYNRRLLFYCTPEGNPQQDAFIATLKESLAMVLVPFYPAAGRLAYSTHSPDAKRVCIDCNDAGVEFLVAAASPPSPHFDQLQADNFQPCPFFNKLAPYDLHSSSEIFSLPLLAIQVTRLGSKGLALGFAHSHVLADGHSIWHLMNSWAECARKEPISVLPLHMRTLLAIKTPSEKRGVMHYPPEGLSADESTTVLSVVSKELLKEKYFQCSRKMIQRLKDEANSKIVASDVTAKCGSGADVDGLASQEVLGTFPIRKESPFPSCSSPLISGKEGGIALSFPKGKMPKTSCDVVNGSNAIECTHEEDQNDKENICSLTSYEALCAHWWRRVTRARGLVGSQIVRFGVLADMRSRLSPKLPPAYFGNVILSDYTYASAEEILRESLAQTAARVHQASLACCEDYFWGFLHWLELHNHTLEPKFFSHAPSLKAVSSPRFRVYDVDFGYGRPIAVRTARTKGDGEMVLFAPLDDHKGGVDICAPFTIPIMDNLLKDPSLCI